MTAESPNLTLRASRMPLALKCAGSVHPAADGLALNPRNEQADVGSAVHDALYELVQHGDLRHTLAQIAAARGVADQLDDVGALYAMGRRMWSQMQPWFGRVLCAEESLEAHAPWGMLTGTADLIGESASDDKTLIVLDWKTGRLDSDYYDQLAAYALLAIKEFPDYQRVRPIIAWLRDGEVETYEFTRADALRWLETATSKIARWDGTYEPGAHCGFCPRRHDCPARLALMRADIAELDQHGDDAAIDAMCAALVDAAQADPDSADRLAGLLEKAKQISGLADRLRSTVRDRLAEQGYPLEGHEHIVSATEQQCTTLNASAAWPILAPVVGEQALREMAQLAKGKALDAIKATAPRGKKGAVAQQYEQELMNAGALRVSTHHRLNVKRSTKSITERASA